MTCHHGAEIRPLLVTTTQRSPTNNRDHPTTGATLQPLIVAGLVFGVGVGFRWSPTVPHVGFGLTVDGGGVNRRREIRALQRVREPALS